VADDAPAKLKEAANRVGSAAKEVSPQTWFTSLWDACAVREMLTQSSAGHSISGPQYLVPLLTGFGLLLNGRDAEGMRLHAGDWKGREAGRQGLRQSGLCGQGGASWDLAVCTVHISNKCTRPATLQLQCTGPVACSPQCQHAPGQLPPGHAMFGRF
jgi:hypothetical protein